MKVTQVEITKQFIKAGLGFSFLPKEIQQEEFITILFDKISLPLSHIYFVTKNESKEILEIKKELIKFFKKIK